MSSTKSSFSSGQVGSLELSNESELSDYRLYRGKCKELSETLCSENPNLRLVRGHYFCPIWNTDEQHWWCEDINTGKIVDPSAKQFPSKGLGTYTPFNGMVECAECGKTLPEDRAKFYGSYAFCSESCICRFVGL
jgi:hypothetical protein